jgi:protein-S-isoprenylcysteine O-methyltransferase Ste14
VTLLGLDRVLNEIWVLSEIAILIVTMTRSGGGEIKDRGSLLVLWFTMFTSINLGVRFGDSHTPTMFGGGQWVRLASIAVMVLGLAIRWTAVVSLGRSFSVNVAIRKKQQLQTAGIYRFVRHPSYLGLLLVIVAIGLHTRSWIGFAIVVFPSLAALSYRIHVGENALGAAFGHAYATYVSRTKRLFPGVF